VKKNVVREVWKCEEDTSAGVVCKPNALSLLFFPPSLLILASRFSPYSALPSSRNTMPSPPHAAPSPAIHTLTADDGILLAYATWEPSEPAPSSTTPSILLLHGWSGSRRYWDPAIQTLLAQGCRVVAPDLRWHGGSGKSPTNHTVARLADDLAHLLAALDRPAASMTAVGASMGSAVLWAHAQRHGSVGLGRHVYVDQAPLQNRVPGWALGSRGCHDADTLAALQAAVQGDAVAFAAGNAAACLAQPIPEGVAALAAAETALADARGLAELMADHTANDWRPVLPTIPCEALIIIGGKSAIFPPEGCAAVAEMMAPPGRAAVVTFTAGGHWLYLEQPAAFGRLVGAFARGGLQGVKGWGDVGGVAGGV
jgi:non-heme chloroperoxidase